MFTIWSLRAWYLANTVPALRFRGWMLFDPDDLNECPVGAVYMRSLGKSNHNDLASWALQNQKTAICTRYPTPCSYPHRKAGTA